ncbi:hypothetical protein AB0C02_30850 [Micromonospora sp. NPDC048999]|uniref:hypothetical protein n=1 Tax=Micromonospora sp. NPDC048999 TaxID=3155391 RepID=UPI003408BFC8
MTAPTRPTEVWQWVIFRPWLGFLAAAIVGTVFGHDQVLAWRHRRIVAGARWLTIAAPPQVTAESAAAGRGRGRRPGGLARRHPTTADAAAPIPGEVGDEVRAPAPYGS